MVATTDCLKSPHSSPNAVFSLAAGAIYNVIRRKQVELHHLIEPHEKKLYGRIRPRDRRQYVREHIVSKMEPFLLFDAKTQQFIPCDESFVVDKIMQKIRDKRKQPSPSPPRTTRTTRHRKAARKAKLLEAVMSEESNQEKTEKHQSSKRNAGESPSQPLCDLKLEGPELHVSSAAVPPDETNDDWTLVSSDDLFIGVTNDPLPDTLEQAIEYQEWQNEQLRIKNAQLRRTWRSLAEDLLPYQRMPKPWF